MRGLFSHWREILLLAVASPGIAELLLSSAPPIQFFVPWVFALFVAFYGAAALLIREAAVRRDAFWLRVFVLSIAFTVLQEGLAVKVFFDPESKSLGPLANHGRVFGINAIWILDGLLYHAAFSIALPILLVYQFFPHSRRRSWMGARGLIATSVVFLFAAAVFLTHTHPYPTPRSYEIACWVAIVLAIVAGLTRRWSMPPGPSSQAFRAASPLRTAALAFAATAGMLFQIFILPTFAGSPWVTLAALLLGAGCVAWKLLQWAGPGWLWGLRQECGLLAGALGCLAVLAPLHEFNPARGGQAAGMSVVGLLAGAGIVRMWRRRMRLPDGESGPLHPVETPLP